MSKRAIISVSNKTGIIELAQGLVALGWEIISTGGTAKYLSENGVKFIPVSEVTGFPEIMDGRVKTLHPAILAGILADRSKKEHVAQLEKLGIKPIDLIIANLYPFEDVTQQHPEGFNNLRSQKFEAVENEAIENIDIGGPTMLRAAAKNFHSVMVVVDPADYSKVLEELKKGETSLETRKRLAAKVFAHTANYDGAIANYFSNGKYLSLNFEKISNLRYGENPHQKAALYKDICHSGASGARDRISGGSYPITLFQDPSASRMTAEVSIVNAQILQGKELSFNNLFDADAALNLIQEFEEPAAAVIKHNNPCGVAVANPPRPTATPPEEGNSSKSPLERGRPKDGGVSSHLQNDAELITEAFKKAWDADPLSAFGGIVALNRTCTREIAEALSKVFIEIVLVPDFSPESLELFKSKPNLRLLRYNSSPPPLTLRGGDDTNPPLKIRGVRGVMNLDFKRVSGGLLVQDADNSHVTEKDLRVVTKKHPSEKEVRDMLFAWKVAKHCKSNAIVLACGGVTVGLGLGQTSRVGSVKIAIQQLKPPLSPPIPWEGTRGEVSLGIVCASDAFFPFRDSIDELAKAGVTAIVQPGGSRNDAEVISAADEHAISMVFTGIRVFRH